MQTNDLNFRPESRNKRPGWEVKGDHGEWVPVDPVTEGILRTAQAKGEASCEIPCGDRCYAIYFGKSGEAERVNLQTKVRRPMRDRLVVGVSQDSGHTIQRRPSTALVASLMDKGFSEDQVKEALAASSNDLNKALQMLMNGRRPSQTANPRTSVDKGASQLQIETFLETEEQARSALAATGNDAIKALELLVKGKSPDTRKQAPMNMVHQAFRWAAGQGTSSSSNSSPVQPLGESAARSAGGTNGSWQVYLGGGWADLESHIQELLTETARNGEKKVKFSAGQDEVYRADLANMVQLNERTGRKRPLRFKRFTQKQPEESPPQPQEHRRSSQGELDISQSSSRYQVFLEDSGWKTISPADVAAIDESVRRGKRIFEAEVRGAKYRVNLEDFTWTNLKTGTVNTIRKLEESAGSMWTSGRKQQEPSETEPLMAPLHRYFSLLAGGEKAQTLTQEDASQKWLSQVLMETAEKDQGRELVLAATKEVFGRMALSKKGCTTRDEWVHYWLLEGSSPSSHALGIIQDELAKVVKDFPKAVGKILSLFAEADTDFDGEISTAEMTTCCKKYVKSCWVTQSFQGATNWLRRYDSRAPRGGEVSSLNYFEFVGELVGRQKHEVWLYQYDISNGLASWAGPVALLRPVEGIWHTGVICFGREYWYGGQCFESKPETTPFGRPNKKTLIGATLCTRAELWDKINRELCREFTRDSYDVLTHNCNHFSDEVCMFLLNKHIPDEVRLQPEQFANSITAQALRPLLNQWLGGFDADLMKGIEEARATDQANVENSWQQIRMGSLVNYAREGLPLVTAEVLAKDEGTCDLWWFQPEGTCCGNFIEQPLVSKMQVTHTFRHSGRTVPRRLVNRAIPAAGAEGCSVS